MDIQFPQILFQIINFGVVFGALSFLLYKPLGKMLEERSKKIEEGQKAAEKNIKLLEEADEQKSKIIKAAEKQAQELIEEGKALAKKQRQEILKKAKQEAEVEIEKQKKNWETEKKRELTNLRAEFTQTTLAVAEKIIGKLDEKTKAKFTNKQLEQLAKELS